MSRLYFLFSVIFRELMFWNQHGNMFQSQVFPSHYTKTSVQEREGAYEMCANICMLCCKDKIGLSIDICRATVNKGFQYL